MLSLCVLNLYNVIQQFHGTSEFYGMIPKKTKLPEGAVSEKKN